MNRRNFLKNTLATEIGFSQEKQYEYIQIETPSVIVEYRDSKTGKHNQIAGMVASHNTTLSLEEFIKKYEDSILFFYTIKDNFKDKDITYKHIRVFFLPKENVAISTITVDRFPPIWKSIKK